MAIPYELILSDVKHRVKGEEDFIANCANTAAILWQHFHQIRGSKAVNWVGFYLVRPIESDPTKKTQPVELVLGPFMGLPARKRIPFNKGVCGTAAATKSTQRVSDVHAFPGHITCDGASQSEIVVPVFNRSNELVGVLDIDCPELNGFSAEDQEGLERVVKLLGEACSWTNLELPVVPLAEEEGCAAF